MAEPPPLSVAMWDSMAQHLREAGLVPEEILVPRPNCIEAVSVIDGPVIPPAFALDKIAMDEPDGD